eukprot:6274301-Amphidinium_carterae.1
MARHICTIRLATSSERWSIVGSPIACRGCEYMRQRSSRLLGPCLAQRFVGQGQWLLSRRACRLDPEHLKQMLMQASPSGNRSTAHSTTRTASLCADSELCCSSLDVRSLSPSFKHGDAS